jgi:hypothetical protein
VPQWDCVQGACKYASVGLDIRTCHTRARLGRPLRGVFPAALAEFLGEHTFAGVCLKGDLTCMHKFYTGAPVVQMMDFRDQDIDLPLVGGKVVRTLSEFVRWATGRGKPAPLSLPLPCTHVCPPPSLRIISCAVPPHKRHISESHVLRAPVHHIVSALCGAPAHIYG